MSFHKSFQGMKKGLSRNKFSAPFRRNIYRFEWWKNCLLSELLLFNWTPEYCSLISFCFLLQTQNQCNKSETTVLNFLSDICWVLIIMIYACSAKRFRESNRRDSFFRSLSHLFTDINDLVTYQRIAHERVGYQAWVQPPIEVGLFF